MNHTRTQKHEPILTPAVVAKRWQVCPETVQRRCTEYQDDDARWLGFRVGRLWRIPLHRMRFWERHLRPRTEEKIVDFDEARR